MFPALLGHCSTGRSHGSPTCSSARSPYVVFHQHLPASPRSSRVPVGVLSVHRYTSTADPQLETLRIYKVPVVWGVLWEMRPHHSRGGLAAHRSTCRPYVGPRRMLLLELPAQRCGGHWYGELTAPCTLCTLSPARCAAHNPDRLSQFDSMPARLCPVCLRKLSVIAHSKFDVVQRYRALIKCFDGAMLGEQSVWFRERLQVITQDFGPADSHGALPVSVPSHRGELANNHSSYGTSYDSHSRRQPEQPRHRAASSTATYASGNGHGNGAPYSVHDRGYRNSLASEMLRHHAHDGASSRRDHSPERRREEPRRRSRLPEEFRSRRTSSVSPQRRRPRGSALARAGFSSVNSSNGELDTKDGGTGSGGGASGGGGGGGGTAHAGQRVHAAGAPPGMAMPAPQGARASPPAVTTGASPPSMRRSSWDGSPPHRRVQPSRLRQPKAHAPLRRVARRSDPTGDSAMRGELGGAVADSRHGPTPQLQGRHSSASLDRSKLSLLKKRMSSRRVSTRPVAQGT